ncbi:hypothetical protein [Rhodopila sp.]|uniref:hypothetical protein n=1 Tax=Rhodopila sp. TaxID=2480087 RepID=UPI003D142146
MTETERRARMEIAEIRDEMAVIIERNLLSRFARAAPKDRIAIEVTARLAEHVSYSTRQIRGRGCNELDAEQHISGTQTLLNGLHGLGTDRIAGTMAETIAIDALQVSAAIRACAQPIGTA